MMAAVRQSRIALKTEPMIVAGIAKDDAARGLKQSELFESCSYEQLAQTPTLLLWSDGHWPEAIPVSSGANDRDWRERHMPYDFVLIYGNERYGQCLACPQAFNDARLRPATVRRGLERCGCDIADCSDVRWPLGSDFQCREPS